MTVLTETIHAGAYLVSEARGFRAREQVKVANAAKLVSGTVLGKITATGVYVTYNPANSDGSQTVAGVLWNEIPAVAGGTGQMATIHARDCEVRASDLTWFAGATDVQIVAGKTALAALGIIAR